MPSPDRSTDLVRTRGLVALFILCLITGPLLMLMDLPAYVAYSVVPGFGLLVSIAMLIAALLTPCGP